jgi:hypothetical protein
MRKVIKKCIIVTTTVGAVSFVNAVDISMSGTVMEATGGGPVPGAIVTTSFFQYSNFADVVKDTTDNQGRFSIKVAAVKAIRPTTPQSIPQQFIVKDNAVIFFPKLTIVSGNAEIFSASGQKSTSIAFSGLKAGNGAVALPRLVGGINVLKLKINGRTFTKKLLCVNNAVYSLAGANGMHASEDSKPAKHTAFIDTLIVMKKEYLSRRIPLDCYNKQDISIRLNEAATNVLQLKIMSSEIPNWYLAADADSFTLWAGDNFYDDMDGGIEKYLNNGMIEVADVHMMGPVGADGEQNTLATHSFIMDFGNDSNASNIFDYQRTLNSADAFDIPGYKNNAVFGRAVLGGITAFAHFKRFYFELTFVRFLDQAQAIATAVRFLSLFQSKIE